LNRSDSLARKKAELQARGVQVPPELIGELETKYNAPAIRTGRMVLCLESPAGNGELIPVFIVNGKRASMSPLHLVKNSSHKYEVWIDDEKYTDITMLPRPKFYEKIMGSGIPMSKLAVMVGPGHLRSVVNQNCLYHRIGKSCKFCAVQHWWDANTEKMPSDVAGAIEAGVKEGLVKHVSLTTATLNTVGKGLEGLVEIARLIRTKVKVPIMLEFEPIGDDYLLDSLLEEAKQAGVTTVSCNIECFDESLRPEVMPMKGRIPVATYVKTWEKCLDVFGNNEVFTVVIAGLGEDDESILRGVELAASVGVVASIVPHTPMKKAVYEDMTPPGVERMLNLYAAALPVYERYGLKLYGGTGGIYTSLKGM
jgi:biotin synthase-related radical SAM superfamily protein